MNKLLIASLPALALLALGGCSATRSVATTEDDGVYYSSKDRTTAIVQRAPVSSPAEAPATAENEAINPDYQGGANNQRQTSNSPEYYDDNYSSSSYGDARFRQPYAGPTVGLAYYNPPVVFAPAIGYGYAAGAYGYSPYGSVFCDPFYSPYYASPYYLPYTYNPYIYSPYGYGYGGSYFNLSFGYGYGQPFYGGYGYGRPYYGAYGYDPYYSGGYHGGGYGNYGGNYGSNYNYSGRQIIRPYGSPSAANNPVLIGPRRERGRGGDVLAGRDNTSTVPGMAPSPTPGGRRSSGGIVAGPSVPANGLTAPAAPSAANGNGRRRTAGIATTPAPNSPTTISDQPNTDSRYNGNSGRADRTETSAPATEPGRTTRGRWRNQEDGAAATGSSASGAGRSYEQPLQPTDAQPQPADRSSRRARSYENMPDNGQGQVNSGRSRGYEQPAPQPQRTYEQPAPQPQRTYEQPAPQPQRTYERPQRTYEQPAPQPQRTYEQPAPQPQRTYERPQRTYEQPAQQPQRTYERPSYSAPSNSQSSSGGSGDNGGGGGGRRGGRQ